MPQSATEVKEQKEENGSDFYSEQEQHAQGLIKAILESRELMQTMSDFQQLYPDACLPRILLNCIISTRAFCNTRSSLLSGKERTCPDYIYVAGCVCTWLSQGEERALLCLCNCSDWKPSLTLCSSFLFSRVFIHSPTQCFPVSSIGCCLVSEGWVGTQHSLPSQSSHNRTSRQVHS